MSCRQNAFLMLYCTFHAALRQITYLIACSPHCPVYPIAFMPKKILGCKCNLMLSKCLGDSLHYPKFAFNPISDVHVEELPKHAPLLTCTIALLPTWCPLASLPSMPHCPCMFPLPSCPIYFVSQFCPFNACPHVHF